MVKANQNKEPRQHFADGADSERQALQEANATKAREPSAKPSTGESNDAGARVKAASIPTRSGTQDEARVHFQNLLAIEPDNVSALKGLGQIALRASELDTAHECFQKILDKDPSNLQALQGLGLVASKRGEHAVALPLFRRAEAIDATSEQTLLPLMRTLFALSEFEAARAIGSRILEHDPGNARAQALLDRISKKTQDQTGKPVRAKAGREDRNAIASQMKSASALSKQSRFDEADAIFERILVDDPSNARALVGRGRIAFGRQDDAGALVHFKAAASAAPDNARMKALLGDALAKSESYDAATEAYREATLLDPGLAQAMAGLGRIAKRKNDWQAAATHFQAASVADPENLNLQSEAATALRDVLRLDEAEAIYAKVLDRSPGDVGSLLGLAEVARLREDIPAALTHLDKARAAAPSDPRVVRATRVLEIVRGDFDWKTEVGDAVAIVRDPDSPIGHLIAAAETLVEYGITHALEPIVPKLESGPKRARQVLLTMRQIERMGLAQPLAADDNYPDPASYQLETLQGYVEIPAQNSNTLLVVFTGARNRLGGLTLTLLHGILRKTGVHILYLRDIEQTMYVQGVVGLGSDTNSTTEAIRGIAARHRATRILTLGNCLGCQGALRYGLALGAEAVLGISPTIRVESDKAKPQLVARVSKLRSALPAEHMDIVDAYKDAARRPKVTLIFTEKSKADTDSARLMSGVGDVDLICIPDSDDQFGIRVLLARGLLEPVLREFVADKTVSSQTLAMIASPNPR